MTAGRKPTPPGKRGNECRLGRPHRDGIENQTNQNSFSFQTIASVLVFPLFPFGLVCQWSLLRMEEIIFSYVRKLQTKARIKTPLLK